MLCRLCQYAFALFAGGGSDVPWSYFLNLNSVNESSQQALPYLTQVGAETLNANMSNIHGIF